LRSIAELSNGEAPLCRNAEGRTLMRVFPGVFRIQAESGEAISVRHDAEVAWKQFLKIADTTPRA
jgi:hypothetical protein